MEGFLKECDNNPTPFHFVENASKLLSDAGYVRLQENQKWDSIPPKFYITHDDQSILAFNQKDFANGTFFISDNDSPHLSILPNSCYTDQNVQLCKVSPIRNGTWYTWLDRDLSISGKVITKSKKSILINTKEPVCSAPSLAIHLCSAYSLQPKFQVPDNFNLMFSLAQEGQPPKLHQIIAEEAHCQVDDIDTYYLSACDATPAELVGVDNGFIASPRLHPNASAIPLLHKFIESNPTSGFISFGFFNPSSSATFLRQIVLRLKIQNANVIDCGGISGQNPNSPNTKLPPCGQGVVIESEFTEHQSQHITIPKLLQTMKDSNIKYYGPISQSDAIYTRYTISDVLGTGSGFPTVCVRIPIFGKDSIREFCCVNDILEFEKLVSILMQGN